MNSPIKIESLSVVYDSKTVLHNFSYIFEPGKFYAIMGVSGIGKTSLISSIMGITKYEGRIYSENKFRISAVFQEDRLCEGISAYKNIKITSAKTHTEQEIRSLIEDFGLTGCASQRVSELSGGMKRRVAILRALLAPHDLLIMDEPFKGLDNETKETVMSIVKKMTSDDTVIMITHDMSEAIYFNAEIINLDFPHPD